MKIAERIVMVVLLLVLVLGGAWIYFAVQHEQQEVIDAVARGEYEIPDEKDDPLADVKAEDWKEIYPGTVSIMIGSSTVEASIADSLSERIKGLSGTPFLPENVVKLFVFGALGNHSIWMKDMNYAIDIMWLSEEGEIIHIEKDVSPDSYPESFSAPKPSWFVLEASAGFSEDNNIEVGDQVVLP